MIIAVAFNDRERDMLKYRTNGVLVFEWYECQDAPFAQNEVVKVAGENLHAQARSVRRKGAGWEVVWESFSLAQGETKP